MKIQNIHTKEIFTVISKIINSKTLDPDRDAGRKITYTLQAENGGKESQINALQFEIDFVTVFPGITDFMSSLLPPDKPEDVPFETFLYEHDLRIRTEERLKMVEAELKNLHSNRDYVWQRVNDNNPDLAKDILKELASYKPEDLLAQEILMKSWKNEGEKDGTLESPKRREFPHVLTVAELREILKDWPDVHVVLTENQLLYGP